MTTESRVSWLGLGAIGFGLFMLSYAIPHWVNSPSNVAKAVLAPTFWPEIIGYILMLLGAILVTQRAITGVSDVVEDAPIIVEEEGEAPPAPPPLAIGPALLRLGLIALTMVVYVWLIPTVGMVWTSMAAFAMVVLITRSPGIVVSLIVAVVLPLLLYAFFAHVAGVAVPQGDYVSLP